MGFLRILPQWWIDLSLRERHHKRKLVDAHLIGEFPAIAPESIRGECWTLSETITEESTMTAFTYNPLENQSSDTLHLADHESYMRFIDDQYETTIAVVLSNPELEQDDNPRAEQIARLFAAAPELLRALTEIVSQIDQGGSGGKVFSRDACISAARYAISKANGR